MTVVKKTAEYKILKRRDGRYAVKNAKGQPVNGDDKVAILREEGLIKVPEPKPEPVAEEETAEETTEEAAAEEAQEEAVEEAPAEESSEEEEKSE